MAEHELNKIVDNDGEVFNLRDSTKLGKTGDSSNTTSTFTKESGDTSSITSGSKLSVIFTAISSFFASILSALSAKADKVDNATNGHLASLDADGNLKDSGKAASDFATSAQGANADAAIKTVVCAAGSNINVVGTPTVSATNDNTNHKTTLTFNYLKGEKGDTGPQGPAGPTNIATSWASTPRDNYVPSEKLVKAAIDNSSVSLSGQTLTVKINGVTKSLTNSTYSFTDSNPTLAWGTKSTVGTVGGTALHVTMPSADSDTYYVSANVTSFSDVLAAFDAGKKLILQIGFDVSNTAAAAYNIPLNRIIFSDGIPSTFTWAYTQDRLQGDDNRGAITTWSLGSSGWETHSEFTYFADTAGLSNKASALVDFGNTSKMTRVGWSGSSISKVIASGSSKSPSESSYLAAYYVADDMGHVKDVKAANVQVGSAKSVNADAGESISSTGTNGSMEILNGALTSSSGGGGSCSIDGDGISFTKGVTGSSMTATSIATAGTGTFTGGANAKGRPIDGTASIVSNRPNVYWSPNTTHLVISRSAGSTTIVDLKDLLEGVVYWLHVPRDNIICLKNSSAISTFYCYDAAFTMKKTTDTYDIRSHIRSGDRDHGGFSTAIVRSSNTFYVMMDY